MCRTLIACPPHGDIVGEGVQEFHTLGQSLPQRLSGKPADRLVRSSKLHRRLLDLLCRRQGQIPIGAAYLAYLRHAPAQVAVGVSMSNGSGAKHHTILCQVFCRCIGTGLGGTLPRLDCTDPLNRACNAYHHLVSFVARRQDPAHTERFPVGSLGLSLLWLVGDTCDG